MNFLNNILSGTQLSMFNNNNQNKMNSNGLSALMGPSGGFSAHNMTQKSQFSQPDLFSGNQMTNNLPLQENENCYQKNENNTTNTNNFINYNQNPSQNYSQILFQLQQQKSQLQQQQQKQNESQDQQQQLFMNNQPQKNDELATQSMLLSQLIISHQQNLITQLLKQNRNLEQTQQGPQNQLNQNLNYDLVQQNVQLQQLLQVSQQSQQQKQQQSNNSNNGPDMQNLISQINTLQQQQKTAMNQLHNFNTPTNNNQQQEIKDIDAQQQLIQNLQQQLQQQQLNQTLQKNQQQQQQQQQETTTQQDDLDNDDEYDENQTNINKKRIKRVNYNCKHQNREHYAKGMCANCYHRNGRTKKPWKCNHKKLYAQGYCQNCYINIYNHKKRTENQGQQDGQSSPIQKQEEQNSSQNNQQSLTQLKTESATIENNNNENENQE